MNLTKGGVMNNVTTKLMALCMCMMVVGFASNEKKAKFQKG